ncbi:MAG TPA: 50S ribosomal protein L30 [Saprospiraceae bacterium]|jgi:large subunit ribosomal protein L30|nr:MAG: 50S ribosomal protein L30 [Candidatus Parvibacillus calidus]MBX2937575.1 50S ribosomal protein L30 [Saprospiraceae bacterium]MBX7177934.1 50S ribosomal protein L30 [Saprospiraceae bacterium]MCB0589962.1 50S ribosomal protein L30 [Saprospiraceae bacterium]MCC7149025.1 50S ribosomal protein L30 [Saprospiraceae bacterium]
MGKLKITQVKSTIDRNKRQKATIEALGIKKVYRSVVHEDTPAIQGMIRAVAHLVKVEEVK